MTRAALLLSQKESMDKSTKTIFVLKRKSNLVYVSETCFQRLRPQGVIVDISEALLPTAAAYGLTDGCSGFKRLQ